MKRFISFLTGILCMTILSAYADSFTLDTSSFASNGTIPPQYSCDGKDASPQLSWKGIPDKTETFALILSDPDAPGGTFYHWVLFNIPKNITALAEGISNLPAGTKAGKNSMNRMRYSGPCPPKGATHHYIFTLYALDTTLSLITGPDAETLLHAMQNHIIGQTELRGLFSHPR